MNETKVLEFCVLGFLVKDKTSVAFKRSEMWMGFDLFVTFVTSR